MLVFENCPVTYPTVLLAYDVLQVHALDFANNAGDLTKIKQGILRSLLYS